MIETGMKVKVGDNIQESFRRYGTSCRMEEMRGKIFPVSEITNTGLGIVIVHDGFRFTFYKGDIEEVKINRKRVKPELFNPEFLMGDQNEY